MEFVPTAQGEHHEYVSWHPAMRPNSHRGLADFNKERESQDQSDSTHLSEVAKGDSSLTQKFRGVGHLTQLAQDLSAFPQQQGSRSPRTEEAIHPEILTDENSELSSIHSFGENGKNQKQLPELGQSSEATDMMLEDKNFSANAYKERKALVKSLSKEMVQGDNDMEDDAVARFSQADYIENSLGGKEEMDRAWEAENMSTSSSRPGAVDRTNTFPEVPPLRNSEAVPPKPLPHSQAANIMEDMEEDDNIESTDRLLSGDGLSLVNTNGQALRDRFSSLEDQESESLFASPTVTQASLSPTQKDEEARYQEGLPLMPSHHMQSFSGHSESPKAAEIPTKVEEGDDNLFNQMSTTSLEDQSLLRPQFLDRKSTNHILDSMLDQPHSANQSNPEAIKESVHQTNLTGEDTAASTNGETTQISEDQNVRQEHSQVMDEELAEIWKAALGDDDLLDELEAPVDPSAFFDEDGEGFLVDSQEQAIGEENLQSASSTPILEPPHNPEGTTQVTSNGMTGPTSSRDKHLLSSISRSTELFPEYRPGQNYSAQTPQSPQAAFGLYSSASAPTGLADATRWQPYAASVSSSRPELPQSTQSFADKSKGGYTSPYDLPMDVAKPRKRTIVQQARPNTENHAVSHRPPPPRSSSMYTGAPPPIKTQPPMPDFSNNNVSRVGDATISATTKNNHARGFFEDLLPPTKPRPSSSMGRIPLHPSQPVPPPPAALQRDFSRPHPITAQSQGITRTSPPHQLLPPERTSLYGKAPQRESTGQNVLPVKPRYSPAPASQPNVPPPRNLYAASPSIANRPPSTPNLLHQPRTSSPLAYGTALPLQDRQTPVADLLSRPAQRSGGGQNISGPHSVPPEYPFPVEQTPENSHPNAYQTSDDGGRQFRQSPPNTQTFNYALHRDSNLGLSHPIETLESDRYSSEGSSFFQKSLETRISAPESVDSGPPQRSQTQSPGSGNFRPEPPVRSQSPYQRSASVNAQMSRLIIETAAPGSRQAKVRNRTLSKDVNYIKPSDGREMDYLDRWKGCPIFTFGFGGSIVTSFPKQIPRYAAGQASPMFKCSPGEVKVQDGKILPLDEDVKTFPGPLKSKSKKKEILEWLQTKISQLEGGERPSPHSATLPDPRKRHVEKILLWRIIRALVECDGVVETKSSAEDAVRTILSPELSYGDSASATLQTFNAPLLGISGREGSHSIANPVSPAIIEELRKLLLHGEREKAVWYAVDNRLWGHAMLLSSTLDKDTWKQVSQEFVRQEVKTFADNTESLAALYQVFAGNWDESMDQLVPPSARAGLQMVSKTAAAGPTKNALDGLDRWRETLTLILSNSSADDDKALLSLGQLLSGYGRIEAAHVCFIFAKSPGLFGGPDDPQVSVALLGADHIQQPFDFGRDLDSILLTEVYEFVRTVLAPSSAINVSPYLQSYKLYHAMILAEYGYKSEAQQYCEVIANALKSMTKPSPYYHSLLFGALENLIDRLRQAPKDNSGSWISKPSIDKVSGSIWAKFNQYVAGDESDAASTGSGKALDQSAGPFARVAGDSPNLSRTPSSTDIYNSYAPGTALTATAPPVNLSASRYAPGGVYTPRSSLEQTDRNPHDHQISTPNDTLRPAFAHQQYQSRPASSAGSYNEPYKPSPQPSGYHPHTESHLPTPPSQPEYMSSVPPEIGSTSLYQQASYQPTPPLEPLQSSGQYLPESESESTGGYDPPATDSYQPPLKGGYEPPSLNSHDALETVDSPTEERPKKKSFLNDADDTFEVQAAAIRKEEKARKDRGADEAFRKAAEADGKLS